MVVPNLLIVLEMLFINLYIAYICSKKKYSFFVTFTVLTLFTIVFSGMLIFVSQFISESLDGSGILMITGFIYIVPLIYLFKQPTKYTFFIMCSSWIYTMISFSLSYRISGIFNSDFERYITLVIQTIILALTMPFFLKLIRGKFMFILNNVENKTMNSIIMLAFLWYVIVVISNYIFVRGTTVHLNIILLLLFSLSTVISYKLFFSLVSVNKHAQILFEKSKKDSLTDLKNREGLYEDVEALMKDNKVFTVIYIDLDNFKTINDRHGHLSGDDYLIDFVKSMKTQLNIDNHFYRMSGDEFVILYDGKYLDDFCHNLEKVSFEESKSHTIFRGLSWGTATYLVDSNDLSELLNMADTNMYQEKKEKHKAYNFANQDFQVDD